MRERFLEETMLCHYLRGAVLKVQIPQVAIISLKFHIYNFFLSGIQGLYLKVKAEKTEFILNIFSANQHL